MNYYKHHLGDYAKKTGALSLMEHGAYLLMLHAYYGSEKPLPIGEDLYRIARAHTKGEKAAVDKVAGLFWTRSDAGLVNGRAFEELQIATDLIQVARDNGAKGGRPKKPGGIPSGLSKNNPAGSKKITQTITQTKAIQDPGSKIQVPSEEIPQPPLEKGASSRGGTRAERNAVKDAAIDVWNQLIASDGAQPPRDQTLQAAIDAVGGWPRIAGRREGIDASMVCKQFCAAYRGAR